jgi:DNA-binding transcriptional regulator YhcF (GntR family)
MQRAVDRLSREGVLTVRHGGGTWLASEATEGSTQVPSRRRAEDVCALIDRDVLSGVLHPGERVPPRKALMARYGVSYRTLRRALEMLCSEGTLRPERRTYRVRETHSEPDQSLCLFVGSPTSYKPSHVHMHTVERECAKANLRLVPVRHRWQGSRFVFEREDLFSREQLASTIGFMVWSICFHEQRCADLLGILRRFDKPVAILDERHGYHRRPIPFASRRVRCAVIAVRMDEGAALGRYLLDLGHRRVLYIGHGTAEGGEPRLEGIRGVYVRAGFADGVAEVHLPQPLSSRSARATGQRELQDRLGPLLDTSIDDDGVTAVVGYNDVFALAALEHIRSRGVAVPVRVSVVGFDDSHEASLAGLTSYNFNSEAAIALLVGHVVAGSGRRSGGPQVDLVEGYVTERGSSGAAPP